MSKIKAGLYGLCVADALGVPAESRTREELKENPITRMTVILLSIDIMNQ